MTTEPSARISFDQYAAYARSYLTRRDRLFTQPSSAAQPGGLSWLTYATDWSWLDPLHHTSSGMVLEQTAGLDRSFRVIVRNHRACSVEEDTAESGSTIDEQEEQHRISNADEWEEPQSEVKEFQVVTVHQTILYSSTWRVPVLWFHAHRANGETIPADDLVRFGIVFPSGTLPLNNDPQEQAQHDVSESSSIDACHVSPHHHLRCTTPPHIVDVPDSQLSTASQHLATIGGISISDHPRTRLPSHYLHPCNTHSALQTLLPETTAQGNTLQVGKEEQEEDRGWRYICAFMSLCAGAVEMRTS